jgi:hypothetical protein
MKTTTITIVSLLGLAGLAFAGDPKTDPKAGAPKPPETKPEPTKAMELPKAPAEVAERVKAMSGTWKCEGTGAGMDGKSIPFKGTMTSKAELDGYWVHDSFAGTMGDGKMAMKFKMESYATFDAPTKKWRTVSMDNMGGQMMTTGDAMKDGKSEAAGEMVSMMGKGQIKDHMDMSDAKKGAHMWGEGSKDNGKSWSPMYDMICKK